MEKKQQKNLGMCATARAGARPYLPAAERFGPFVRWASITLAGVAVGY
jgi:hypothetical protein